MAVVRSMVVSGLVVSAAGPCPWRFVTFPVISDSWQLLLPPRDITLGEADFDRVVRRWAEILNAQLAQLKK